jgi:sugar phosphate isomerase/epimerase
MESHMSTAAPRFACMELVFGDISGAKFEPWLDEIRDMGFDGVALRAATTLQSYLDDSAAFVALLARKNLKLAGVYAQLSSSDEFIARVCRFLKSVGCHSLILHGAKRGGDAERAEATALMKKHAAAAHLFGIAVSFHHHTHTPFETFAETETLLLETNPAHVHLFLDTGHAHLDFVDLPVNQRTTELLKRHWPRVDYLEFKDCAAKTGLSTELGKGEIDFPPVAALLKDREYAGWIVLEQNSTMAGSTASADVARGLQFAKSVFSQLDARCRAKVIV